MYTGKRMVGISNSSIETVDISTLKPHPKNPRKGNINAILESMRVNGFYGVLIAQKSTRYVLAGNHRLLAAKQLGIEEVPVAWVDVDKNEAMKILLADNRTNDLAQYDNDVLAELLADLKLTDTLDGTGYDSSFLDGLIDEQIETVNRTPPEDFKQFDENIETEHRCPKCGYEWSGG